MALFGRDYDRDYGYYGATRGYDLGYRGGMYGTYDRDYAARGFSRYDENYKSRWQTDYGDPFGDRTSRTPMRMIRGEFHAPYDRGFRATGYDRSFRGGGYDRDYYAANPATYDPYMNRGYEGRTGTWNRYDVNYGVGGYNRGYDRGWF